LVRDWRAGLGFVGHDEILSSLFAFLVRRQVRILVSGVESVQGSVDRCLVDMHLVFDAWYQRLLWLITRDLRVFQAWGETLEGGLGSSYDQDQVIQYDVQSEMIYLYYVTLLMFQGLVKYVRRWCVL
jgi:hypothetical protein